MFIQAVILGLFGLVLTLVGLLLGLVGAILLLIFRRGVKQGITVTDIPHESKKKSIKSVRKSKKTS